jgi:hypothetical protein
MYNHQPVEHLTQLHWLPWCQFLAHPTRTQIRCEDDWQHYEPSADWVTSISASLPLGSFGTLVFLQQRATGKNNFISINFNVVSTLLSFSCDSAVTWFRLLHFWRIFDELYLLQIFTDSLVILVVESRLCRLGACQFIESETPSLIFPFLTSTLRTPIASNGYNFCNTRHNVKQFGNHVYTYVF